MICIEISGIKLGINNLSSYVESQWREYIVDDEPLFLITVSREEIEKQQKDFPSSYAQSEELCIERRLCLCFINYNAFLMHAAVVAVGGKAYAFLGKSGIGKTTHIRLWKELLGDRCIYLNGDKPIFRLMEGVFYACGTPWQGKERYGSNIIRPLAGLCFLEQAAENRIERLPLEKAYVKMLHQLLIPLQQADLEKLLVLVDQLLKTVPCYLLHCNKELEAAEISYSAMTGGV